MKQIKRIALPVMLLLHLLPPLYVLAVLARSCFGSPDSALLYEKYPLVYAVIVFLATLSGAIFRRRIMPEKGFGRACALLLLPVALINTLCASFEANIVSIILLVLSCVCALLIFLISPNRKWAKVLGYVFSFILALLATIIVFLSLTFGSIGRTTVVQKKISPDGKHIAYLIDVDQGALGGDTKIEIVKKPVNLLFGRYTDYYYADWDNWAGVGVLSEITFEWKDNDTLIYGNTEINVEE